MKFSASRALTRAGNAQVGTTPHLGAHLLAYRGLQLPTQAAMQRAFMWNSQKTLEGSLET